MPCGLTHARHDAKQKDKGHVLQEEDGKQEENGTRKEIKNRKEKREGNRKT